jgi:hypothetical protein
LCAGNENAANNCCNIWIPATAGVETSKENSTDVLKLKFHSEHRKLCHISMSKANATAKD